MQSGAVDVITSTCDFRHIGLFRPFAVQKFDTCSFIPLVSPVLKAIYYMNNLRKLHLLLLVAVCFSISAFAAEQRKLIPYPQKVELGSGTFTVTSATRIVLSPKHAKEDRVAAEMLAEEIESAIGTKVKIVTAAVAPAGSIRLTRVGDAALKGNELDSQSEEAYLIVADARHIVVGGRSSSGTFDSAW